MNYKPDALEAVGAYVLAVAFDQGVEPTTVDQPDTAQAVEQITGLFNIRSKQLDERGRPSSDLAVCDYNEYHQAWTVILKDDIAVSVAVTEAGLSVLGYSLRR